MDYNERLEQMRREMEQRRREMEERLYRGRSRDSLFPPKDNRKKDIVTPPEERSTCAVIGKLECIKGLEDVSETKLGNFDKLITSYIKDYDNLDKKFASFGYSDEDLAPLINLLTAIVEIEFNVVFYKYLKEWGIEIKYPAMKTATLGDLKKIYCNDKGGRKYLKDILTADFSESERQFTQILEARNKANHANVFTLNDFLKFYKEEFFPFYNKTIRAILPYKKKSSRKFGVSDFNSSFAAYDVALFSESGYQEQLSRLFPEGIKSDVVRKCIILTNSDQLALKYYGAVKTEVEKDDGQKVLANLSLLILQYIHSFIEQASTGNVRYYLFDVADNIYGHLLDDERSWFSHLAALDSFCRQNRINSDSPFSLFILGGDDVIPMPRLKNPNVTAKDNADKMRVLESTLEVDWLYAFPLKNVVVGNDGYLEYEALAGVAPRFHVSRLPLETGLMETTFENDIVNYLQRDLQELAHGIDVKTFTLVACDSAKMVANKIVEGMPVTAPSPSVGSNFAYGNAFISPKLSIDIEIVDEEHKETIVEYISHLKQTDLLTFVLHGSSLPNLPHFVGQDLQNKSECPIAFSIDLFQHLPTKVVVPICCWGGRFINYRREKSALLSAVYSNTLVFLGSCRSALGIFDNYFVEHNQPVQIGCAEVLQRLFLAFLLAGYPAGEALSFAKSTYLGNLADPSSEDLLTVLEFNLFGDPMLRVNPLLDEKYIIGGASHDVSITLPNFSAGTFRLTTSVIYDSDDNNLLKRVRNLVDSNLNDIRNRLNKLLPEKYGIDPSTLRRIEKCSYANKGDTYRFSYAPKEMSHLVTYVTTSIDGNIKSVIGTM